MAASRDPVEILRRSLRRWWIANSGESGELQPLGKGFSVGQIGQARPYDPDGGFPRVNVRFGPARLRGTSNDSRYHRATALFEVLHNSPEQASDAGKPLYKLLERMESRPEFLIPLDIGELVGLRVIQSRTVQARTNVHFAEYTTQVDMRTNRG